MSGVAAIKNSGYLKLDLAIRGLKLSRNALVNPEIDRAVRLAQAGGAPLELNMVLPENVALNIPVRECLAEDRAYSLTEEDGHFFVAGPGGKVEVWVVPLPAFYDNQTSTGVPMVKIARAYAGYLAVSPTPTCEFIAREMACQYCDLEAKKGRDWTIEEVLETVDAALSEGAVEFVCLNVGYTETPDGGVALLEPYIKAIKKHFNVLICVQAQPPSEDRWIDAAYAMGIDSIAFNLEAYDPEVFARIAPGKMRIIGRERYFEALRHAARIFPSGAVVSNLIVGLEPLASTLKGIDALTAMGAIPTLPLYKAAFTGRSDQAVMIDHITPVYLYLEKALHRNRLSPTWISHFNLALNTIDSHFFGGQTPVKKRWQRVMRSKHGGRIARSISNFRRRLRVTRIEEDSNPSGF